MRLRAALSIAALCILSHSAWAESSTNIESFTLSNGLEVLVIPNHRVPAVSHMLWYRIGAADDPPGKSGLAHYHEHMMFEGTKTYKPGEYAQIIASHGGQQNAFTGHDATSYYVNIAKSELPLIMELEADRMRGLNLSDQGAAKEKEVIIEERRMRVENDPEALLAEQMNAALFRNHPYHWPVIGWMHEMQGLTKNDVIQFHNTYYHPNNAILIISGDVTVEEIKPLVQRYYGNLPKAPIPARHWNDEPPQLVERHLIMRNVNVQKPSWSRYYTAASLGYGHKENALPLSVLAQVLGGGKTGLLYQSLVVEQKLASAVDCDYDAFVLGPSTLQIQITPEEGVDPSVLEVALDKELAAINKQGISEDKLTFARTLLKSDSIYTRDGLNSMARIMGWLRIVGLDKDYFTRWPQLIDAVTAEQVNSAMRETLVPEHSVTGILLPAKTAENTP